MMMMKNVGNRQQQEGLEIHKTEKAEGASRGRRRREEGCLSGSGIYDTYDSYNMYVLVQYICIYDILFNMNKYRSERF